jgi:UDP-glucose 4-epimerase
MTDRRIVVTGASGNVGTGVLRALAAQLPDAEIVGISRRTPDTTAPPYDRVRWHEVDLAAPEASAALEPVLNGASAVVHLAWAIQPVREEERLRRTNVDGTRAVLRAAVASGVPHVVYASSLGVYAPGSREPVDEAWPDSGQRTSTYSRHKVEIERLLDQLEREHPDLTVARIRPTLVVQREAATEIRTLFLGPLVPRPLLDLLRRRLLPLLPVPAGLQLQFVHADDVGDAVVRIVTRRASGVFNLAADALGASALAALVGARPVRVGQQAVRAVVSALFAARCRSLPAGSTSRSTPR